MALGKSTGGNRPPSVFVDLRTNAKKEGGVGFRQVLSKTPNPDAATTGKPFVYETVMHDFVQGRITGFRIKEAPTYDDPAVKEKLGLLRISDAPKNGAEAGPDVYVSFKLATGMGRKLVGLVANALVNVTTIPEVHIKTNVAAAGDKIGDQVLTEPRAFISANIGDAQGARIRPEIYLDSSGNVRMNGDIPAALPHGKEVTVNRKTVLDFSEADQWVEETAAIIAAAFQEEHAEAESHGDGVAGEDSVDLAEAAAAASGHAPTP